jgi:hypothetical protein
MLFPATEIDYFSDSMTKVKPTVLIATATRWVPTARMAQALANAGCTVEAVCPPGHPLAKTSSVRQRFTYHGLWPLVSFADAIAATRPDLIIPGDDRAAQHLHALYDRERRGGKTEGLICRLIERSLGAPDSFPVVYQRSTFLELAEQEGIRVPKTAVVSDTVDLEKWGARFGFPLVLKANGSSGGDGVRIAHTPEDARRALRTLQAPPLLARAAKRALIDRDTTLVWPSLLRRRSVVNAQAFVSGSEATSAIACWNGAVLAELHFEVLQKTNSAGPATVVRLIENREMSAAAERMVRRLNLSGLHGFDFILEEHTRNAQLIEINPRTTQVGHLRLGPGRDLPAAMYAAVSGEALQPGSRVTENDTIALFPREWLRDPESPYLRSGYHDVPWEAPDLVRECVRKRQKQWVKYSEEKGLQVLPAIRLPHR